MNEYELFWDVYEALEEKGVEMDWEMCELVRHICQQSTEIAEAFVFRTQADE